MISMRISTESYRSCFVLPVGLLLVCGCFPLEIDVTDDGQMLIYRQEGFFLFEPATKRLTPITGPGANRPLFARFRPKSQEVLTVVEDGANGEHQFDLVSLADGTSKTILKKSSCTYARFSPDGKRLGLTRIVTKSTKKGPNTIENKQVGEFDVVDLATGNLRRFQNFVPLPFFRWFGDSDRVLVFSIEREIERSRYLGHIVVLNVVDGSIKKLATAASDRQVFLDISPDNQKAVIVVRGLTSLGQEPVLKESDFDCPLIVHEINFETAAIRDLKHQSSYAIYSPNGNKILMAIENPERACHSLTITNGDGSKPEKIVEFSPPSSAYMEVGGEAVALPGWCGNDTIFYLDSRAVFGKNRQAPWLHTIALANKKVETLQPYLDVAVLESEVTLRNPRRAPKLTNRQIILPGED